MAARSRHAGDVLGIDRDALAAPIGRVEGDVVEHPLHHGLQATRADVLDIGVELDRDLRQRIDRVLGEVEGNTLGLEQRLVLADEARLRLGQDAAEILLGEGPKLDADRQAPLQLRQKIRRFGDVEPPEAMKRM